MKKAIVAATLVYLLGAMAAMARASDFAFIKTSAPEALAGTFFAKDGSGSSAGGAVAIVTHKIIPSNNIISSIVTPPLVTAHLHRAMCCGRSGGFFSRVTCAETFW